MIQSHIKNNLESFVISALLWKANKKSKLRNYKLVLGLQNSRTFCERERCVAIQTKDLERPEETLRKAPEGGWGETLRAAQCPPKFPNQMRVIAHFFLLLCYFYFMLFSFLTKLCRLIWFSDIVRFDPELGSIKSRCSGKEPQSWTE